MTDRERMIKVMETENLSAKQFALEVGIQPGTISNIAGGRNNPSLDVMQKIYKRFPHYSAAWLFSDKGPMYYRDADEPNLFTAIAVEPAKDEKAEQAPVKEPVQSVGAQPSGLQASVVAQSVVVDARRVQRIMIFYSDGTYEER